MTTERMNTKPERWDKRLLLPLAIGTTVIIALGTMSCASQQAPTNIGLAEGTLRPCPESPNCVASENTNADHEIRAFEFQGTPEAAWHRLADVVHDEGGRIEEQTDNYLWATFRSLIFRFVDDVEFRLDRETATIHVRSAARTGYSDFGVNRRRVERLRKRWQQQDTSE